MSLEVYRFDTGVAETEQDVITAIDDFLVNTVGTWTRIETVSDTASNRDYAWSSVGSDPDNYDTIFIRIRGQSNQIHFYGYSYYESSSVNSFEIYNGSFTYLALSSSPIRYWLVGNEDFIQVHTRRGDTGGYYLGYAGLIRSYYIPENDNYPLMIRGQSSTTTEWEDSNAAYMYNTTTSGEGNFQGFNWDSVLGFDLHYRTNELCLLPVVMYSADGSNEEVRGEPYGVYQVNGRLSGHQSVITSVSGTFVVFKMNTTDSKTYAYGPVASGTTDVSLW
jgi:hypothetical protein